MPLGDRLRQLRELSGLSQSELAIQAGIARPIITRLENGTQKTLTLESARRICRVLHISIDILAGHTPEDSTP